MFSLLQTINLTNIITIINLQGDIFMEHHNTLLTNVDTSSKFITIGEILLRLTPLT